MRKKAIALVGSVLMGAGLLVAGAPPASAHSFSPANHRDWDDWDDWSGHCGWWNDRWDDWGDWGHGHGRWDRWCWNNHDDWQRWRHHRHHDWDD